MLKRASIILAVILPIASATLVLWQGSFKVGSSQQPADPSHVDLFPGLPILVLLVMLSLGFVHCHLVVVHGAVTEEQ